MHSKRPPEGGLEVMDADELGGVECRLRFLSIRHEANAEEA
jgi:hypothetical protein